MKFCGSFIPDSGKMRIAPKTEATFLEIPLFDQGQDNISKDFSKFIHYTDGSVLNQLISKWLILQMEDHRMHKCHPPLGTTQWPERRVKRHPSLNLGF